MYEYQVITLREFELEEKCNALASEGWRLISANVTAEYKIHNAQVMAVFEREKAE